MARASEILRRTIGIGVASSVLVVASCTSGPDDRSTDASPEAPEAPAPLEPGPAPMDVPWRPHPIDWRFKGANSLGPGDVNGDGFDDYVTNYEFAQRYSISLHPGPDVDPRLPWPTVDVFGPACDRADCGVNPEYATLADLDDDGGLDLVAAQGWSEFEEWEGSQPGIRVIWGPEPDEAGDPSAWQDAGLIPVTDDQGHYHFLRAGDVDGDGALDIIAGGRVHGGNDSRAGLLWLEAPEDPAERRDLSLWSRHDIAPDQTGGRNFVLVDLDDDGDDDIVVANADFDTPEQDEGIYWYEHPGTVGDAVRGEWTERELYRGDEFHAKPQIAVADLDDDGEDDLITQVTDAIYWFRKTDTDPVTFERVVIPKDPSTTQLARPIRVADLDGDGQLDLIGGLVHEDGVLGQDKASLFWMSYEGDLPAADNWTTHVITRGAGRTGIILDEFAEKWDLLELVDVDDDGDLDIVANNEEWWADGGQPQPFWEPHQPAVQAVVWYENRLDEQPEQATERDGQVLVEAEAFAGDVGGAWTTRADVAGWLGTGFAQATELDGDLPPSEADSDATRTYPIEVDGGSYDLWARVSAPETWGVGMGGARSDSAWLVVDDDRDAAALIGDDGVGPDWTWVRVADEVTLERGQHSLALVAREGGFRIDQLALTLSGTEPRSVPGPEQPA